MLNSAAGTSTAVVIHLILTVAGMTTFLALLADGFETLRWIGVGYLLWLGIKAWRAPASDLSNPTAEPRLPRKIFLRAFLVGLTNPKTLLFYGAFFPQFIDPAGDAQSQLLLLAVTFLAVAIVFDGSWPLLASRLRGALGRGTRLRNRLTGGFLIGAGLGLALARRP